MDDSADIVKEFLIESYENIGRLDQEFVALEKSPRDQALLSSIFRTIHTIKGTCGFLNFTKLESITHIAENLLSQLRQGERELTAEIVSALLETVDAVKRILGLIESSGAEGEESFEGLKDRLRRLTEQKSSPAPGAAPPAAPAAPAAESPEAAETAGSGGSDAGGRTTVADSTIRVDVSLLDKLMNLVGELVLARNQILQFTGLREDAGFSATSQRLNLITTELQAGVMKTRMQPIGNVWNKLPRVVRDLAASCGKQVSLEMEGADTELDKTIIEAIRDPLTHIVRNSVDHGIETPGERVKKGKPSSGRLSLRAFHEGGQVNIETSDDGAGIAADKVKRKAIQNGLVTAEQAERLSEREALRLIFLPGFSTAEKVTAVSGRGVGMDVVKTNIEKIGGMVDVQSRVDRGTTIKIKIPLTLAIIPALVVTSGGERFAIPQVSLLELVRLEGEAVARSIEQVHGTPVYRLRGHLLPLVRLTEVLETRSRAAGEPGAAVPDAAANDGVVNIVVLQADERQFGLVVDRVNDTEEIVVKPLGKQLKGISAFAGATIMGDGQVALILDVLGLAQRAKVVGERRDQTVIEEQDGAPRTEAGEERQTFLLFRAGQEDRLGVPLGLVARLEEFPQEQLERASGQDVVQYRNQILPLVRLAAVLGMAAPPDRDPLQVIVFSEGERRIGVVVDSIIDIAEDRAVVQSESRRPGVLGSAVIGQKVTDLIDLQEVISAADPHWFERAAADRSAQLRASQGQTERRRRVLLVENSAFFRGVLRGQLETAGYRVVEAADGVEALERLAEHPVDAVLTNVEMPRMNGLELAERLRKEDRFSGLPVIAMTELAAEEQGEAALFSDSRSKFDRAGMLQALERLAVAVSGERARPGQPERTEIHA